jgi:putative transcriptional regulator
MATKSRTQRKPRTDLLAAIHETATDLHRAGTLKAETMREFDALCLTPVVKMAPEEIKALREREHVSQPVFAHYLNVTKSVVSQWERGEKHPAGASLKLLNVVKNKGLRVLA